MPTTFTQVRKKKAQTEAAINELLAEFVRETGLNIRLVNASPVFKYGSRLQVAFITELVPDLDMDSLEEFTQGLGPEMST